MLPTQPPLDGDGNVTPHDHPDILNTDEIIRRVTPQHVIDDPKADGGKRLSSALFQESSGPNGGMSIDLKRPIEEDGFDAASYVTVEPYMAAVLLTASQFRDVELKVGYHPLPDNPYHGEVWGNFSKRRQKALLRLCSWLVPVPGIAHPSGSPIN